MSDDGARPASRNDIVFGVAVGVVAVSAVLFGSACAAYGAPTPDQDAAVTPDAR